LARDGKIIVYAASECLYLASP